MNRLRIIFLGLTTVLFTCAALAQSSPAGLWQSIDDSTGRPRAEIRITESNGVWTGRIERSLVVATSTAIQLCDKCMDDRKDKPLIGLDIVRGLKAASDGQSWEGGTITDPDTGKVYRLRLSLLDDSKKLQVRGYIGPFFRNQTWVRKE